jgi:hypothetical protein
MNCFDHVAVGQQVGGQDRRQQKGHDDAGASDADHE